MAKTVVVSGYYGFANSGDEAVLHAIVTALREEAREAGRDLRIVVLSGNPPETERLHGVEAVHRMKPAAVLGALMRADVFISGGGSLLQDVTSSKTIPYYVGVIRLAQLLRKPSFIYAQGIGPIQDPGRFGPMIRKAFERCRYISVRDDESKALVASFGVKPERIEVVPDPVMGMGTGLAPALGGDDGKRAARLGVSVRFWRKDRGELDALAAGLAQVAGARSDVRIVFLPFHLPSDKEASEYVAGKLAGLGVPPERYEVHPGTAHPRDMLHEVSLCDALIGMRLHSLIYAATAGVPPIGISYDPKIDQFLRRLGESPAGDTGTLASDKLSEAVLQRLNKGKSAWKSDKIMKIQEMQQNSRKPAQQILSQLRI